MGLMASVAGERMLHWCQKAREGVRSMPPVRSALKECAGGLQHVCTLLRLW